MAKIKLEAPFYSFQGAVENNGIIYRRKKYKDANGNIIREGEQEAYCKPNPRDYKKNPPKGNELESINRFREAARLTKLILQAPTIDLASLTTQEQQLRHEQLMERYVDFQKRFVAQLDGKPDPQAPLNKSTRQPNRYSRLDNFIRAMLIQELKNNPNSNPNNNPDNNL